jgi:hypothetical protein
MMDVEKAMASSGQTTPQWPHPIHQSPLTTQDFPWVISRTKLGHTSKHNPQPLHLSARTLGGLTLGFILFDLRLGKVENSKAQGSKGSRVLGKRVSHDAFNP